VSDWSVDALGQSGVQLFVDAGRPVDSALVTALVREVLAEKISAMFAERLELDLAAHQQPTAAPTSQPDTVTAVLPKQTVCYAVQLLHFDCTVLTCVCNYLCTAVDHICVTSAAIKCHACWSELGSPG